MLVYRYKFNKILVRILPDVATIDFRSPSFYHAYRVATPNGNLTEIIFTELNIFHTNIILKQTYHRRYLKLKADILAWQCPTFSRLIPVMLFGISGYRYRFCVLGLVCMAHRITCLIPTCKNTCGRNNTTTQRQHFLKYSLLDIILLQHVR